MEYIPSYTLARATESDTVSKQNKSNSQRKIKELWTNTLMHAIMLKNLQTKELCTNTLTHAIMLKNLQKRCTKS